VNDVGILMEVCDVCEYLLIAQDAIAVEHFVCRSDKLSMFDVITDPPAVITLTSIECRLREADIYAKIVLPPIDTSETTG